MVLEGEREGGKEEQREARRRQQRKQHTLSHAMRVNKRDTPYPHEGSECKTKHRFREKANNKKSKLVGAKQDGRKAVASA